MTLLDLYSLIPLMLVALCCGLGYWREQCHLRSLSRREKALAVMLVTDLKTIHDPTGVEHAQLVMGDAVIATDFFKSFASQLRNLVGGQVRSVETLMVRARREAILRMLEQARDLGATEVHNVRLETSNVMSRGGGRKAFAAEVFAFGTAVRRNVIGKRGTVHPHG